MAGVKKYLFLLLLFPFISIAQDTLTLSRIECEELFLKENLQLMAEKLQISKADALVRQAKLWPNPTLEIDEVNLWASQKQLAVFGDELQGFNGGSFGKNQQLAFSIEQLILTAGKRRKLVAIEKVSAKQAETYFDDLLRNLKIEFRDQLTHLQYLQKSEKIYRNQLSSIKKLTDSYQRQMKEGNIGKGTYIRLKAVELSIAKDINELNTAILKAQKELKMLMRLPSDSQLKITDEGFIKEIDSFDSIILSKLIEDAKEHRPDYKSAKLEETYYNSQIAYEKAQRIPNLSVKGGYDRGGNFMYDFVGFGLSIDLPFFDRNQGNVRHAQIGLEQSELFSKQKELGLENETVLAYQKLKAAIQFLDQIEEGYEDTLDELLLSYTKNFTSKNISIIEYLDFLDAYLENKDIILEAHKEVNEKAEELNYTIGQDVIK